MEDLEIKIEGETPPQPEAAAGPDPETPPGEPVAQGETPQQAEAATGSEPEMSPAGPVAESEAPQEPEAAPAPAPETPPAEPVAQSETPQQAEAAADPQAPSAEPVAIELIAEDLLAPDDEAPAATPMEDVQLMAVLEAVIYVAEEPLTMAQIAAAIGQPIERVDAVLRRLIAELEKPEHGIAIREVAGGFKMATKAEHHEAVRSFVKSLKPPMKLSLPALETLAVIAYKQPVTAPEIMEIRGVQGAGVLKTLLDRKLIAVAGRKNVIGKPILYKTTRDFLIQFGLNDVGELPSLKEFEEIRRMAFADSEPAGGAIPEQTVSPADPSPQPVPQPEPEPSADPAAKGEEA